MLMNGLGSIVTVSLDGDRPFHDGTSALGFDLLGFWQWSCSDLLSNTTRGVLAEFLVAKALGGAGGVREEWAAYDLTAEDGTRIEVKSAAYIQSWHQEKPSRITFRIPGTRAWDRVTNRYEAKFRRQADVYVFALLAHMDKATIDPLDVSQWEFLVVPTARLDAWMGDRRTILLAAVRGLAGETVTFAELRDAIRAAAGNERNPMSASRGTPLEIHAAGEAIGMPMEPVSRNPPGAGSLSFRGIDPERDRAAVVDFLVGDTWPFHGKSRPTAEQAARVKLGPPEEVRAFWIEEHGECIGFVRLFDLEDADDGSVQFDLRIAASQRGRGVGRRAVAWLTRFLFEAYPQLHRIEASTRADNDAMRRVLGLNGYRLEGLLRETWRSDDGTRYETALFGRLRNEG